MTHSRFVAANSFSRFTSSLSFASVDSISLFFLSSRVTSFPRPLRLHYCRLQILRIHRPPRPRRSLHPPPPPPPPKPPPPQPPPPEILCELPHSLPRRSQSKPLPPDPPPRDDKLA